MWAGGERERERERRERCKRESGKKLRESCRAREREREREREKGNKRVREKELERQGMREIEKHEERNSAERQTEQERVHVKQAPPACSFCHCHTVVCALRRSSIIELHKSADNEGIELLVARAELSCTAEAIKRVRGWVRGACGVRGGKRGEREREREMHERDA